MIKQRTYHKQTNKPRLLHPTPFSIYRLSSEERLVRRISDAQQARCSKLESKHD